MNQPVSYFVTELFRGIVFPDRHIAVRMTVHLNTGTVHALHPGVQLFLCRRDVALVSRASIGLAHRHGPL